MIDQLPIIITEPGEYETRRGERATINDVEGKGYSFNCSGFIHGSRRPHESWHPSGRLLPFECGGDIVRKLQSSKE